jgi:hypothetical protein
VTRRSRKSLIMSEIFRRSGQVERYEVQSRIRNVDVLITRIEKQLQNDFLREWLPWRPLYLKIILAMEGLRDPELLCQSCNRKPGKWRCKHCLGARTLCGVCCRNEHQFLPFHRIERWNGRYFQVGALWQVGLRLSLGHEGMTCPSVARMETDAEDEGKYVALE